MKNDYIPRTLIPVLAVLIGAICWLSVSAQTNAYSAQRLESSPSPVQETFTEADGLVLPWLNSGCYFRSAGKIEECHFVFFGKKGVCNDFADSIKSLVPNCYEVSWEQWRDQDKDVTDLYNSDGSLWYRFSNYHKKPDYFTKDPKSDFLPFATTTEGLYCCSAVLRLVGESPNWYEVEVNERTRATKFIRKNDPKWAKMTWGYWLGRRYQFFFDSDSEPQLRDKPNGDPVGGIRNLHISYYEYLDKTDGEWALFKGVSGGQNPETIQGWLRWRDGRKLLLNSDLSINRVAPDDQSR